MQYDESNTSELVRAHQPCPKCGSHDACAVYTDHYHCFSCGAHWYEDGKVERVKKDMEEVIQKIEEGKIREIADRCISRETCEKFGVRTLVKDHKIAKHFYPYYSKEGRKVAEKTRVVEGKQFYWTGDQTSLQLFGAQCQPTTGRFVVVTEGECFKGDTCVLTRKGWVRLDEWSGQDVMQVSQEGASFVKPLAYVNKDYSGDMYCVDRNKYSICTTPDHNMVLLSKDGTRFEKIKMKDITYQRNVPVFTTYSGSDMWYSDTFLRILVAISADGSIDVRSDGRKYVRIAFMKDRKIERMRELLKLEKIPYHEGVHASGHTCFCFNCQTAFKEFPWSWIYQLSARQRQIVLDELQYWDGYKPKTRDQIEYYTTSYHNAVFVQTLASTSGMYAGICTKHYKEDRWLDGYTVRICFSVKHVTVDKKCVNVSKYQGRVYCVQVPSGMLLVRNGSHISVCGNCDCLTMWQVLGGRYTCVSIPNGCKSFKALKDNYEYLDKFENIVLCLDGDKAGREAVEKAAMVLPQKKLKIMKLPETMKDPNEFLKAGKADELVNYFWRAEPYTPKDIVNCSVMYDRLMDYKKSHQYVPTPWTGLNDMLQGTRPGQVVVFAAGSGSGKSSYLRAWMLHLLNCTDYHIGTLYLEETPEETVLSMMSQVAGKNLKKPAIYDACTPEEIKEYFDKVCANSRIDLFDPIIDIDPDYICNKIRYMAVVRDCKYIVLDHLTFVATAEDNVKAALDRLMNKLHRLATELGLVILCACHLRKTAVTQKSAEEGARITLADFKDSSSIYQLSDICLALERNSQDPDPTKANTTVIRILKNRDFGEKGVATAVYYDVDTTRLIEVGLEDLASASLDDDVTS